MPTIRIAPDPGRIEVCQHLVNNKSARIIRDGKDHSEKAHRCLDASGNCVGYWCVLSSYDADTDTFLVGWERRIPSYQVDQVGLYDALTLLCDMAKLIDREKGPMSQLIPLKQNIQKFYVEQ